MMNSLDTSPLLAQTLPPGFAAILLAWLAAMGGAIGSFLNVVVYRVPHRMSLVQPGSHCPVCKHPIRWHDNVPVLGWLMLRGRCRDCHTWIPVRYPAVEAFTAAVFLTMGLAAVASGGTYLPARPEAVTDGVIYPPLTADRLVGLLAFHAVLFCTLIAAVLIEYDGTPFPWRVLIPAGLTGGLAPLAWPYLHPVPATPVLNGWPAGAIDGLLGGAVGGLLGAATCPLLGAAGKQCRGWLGATLLVGVFLGWQAVAVLTIAAVGLHGLSWALSRGLPRLAPIRPTAWLSLAAWVGVLVWGFMARL